MPTYIGFSTINSSLPRTTNAGNGIAGAPGNAVKSIVYGKKYRLVDDKLVIQDFINALNIPKGQKVGQPGYGTDIWSYVFEQNNSETHHLLEEEIKKVASYDPRLIINYVSVYPRENGILLEAEVAVTPFNQPLTLNIFFNQDTTRASLI